MGREHSHSDAANLKVAFFLNLAFTGIEIAGGLWTNSVAILTDAVHDFGDCASLGLAWYLQRVSARQQDEAYTYGYRRFSALGALITALMLTISLGFVAWQAIERLFKPEAVFAPGMIVIAVVGVVMNGLAVLRVRKGSSLSEKLVTWHLLEDVFGWLAVLVAAVVISIWQVPIVDPILSLGIAAFVLFNVGRNLNKVAAVFLQRTPDSFDVAEFERKVRAFPGVTAMHHTHVWTLDGEHHVLTTHVVMRPETTREQAANTKAQIRCLLDRKEFEHVTIDVELDGEACASDGDRFGVVG